jgi:hypothetical protein
MLLPDVREERMRVLSVEVRIKAGAIKAREIHGIFGPPRQPVSGYTNPRSLITLCHRGHKLVSGNVYIGKAGNRQCRECRRINQANFKKRHQKKV